MQVEENFKKQLSQAIEQESLDIKYISLLVKDYKKFYQYNPQLVLNLACKAVGLHKDFINPSQIKSRSNKHILIKSLFIVYMRKNNVTTLRIGTYLGKNHSTILNSIKSFEELREIKDKQVVLAVDLFNILITQNKNELCQKNTTPQLI